MNIEQLNNITDDLEARAQYNYEIELEKTVTYKEGYIKACEDFRKKVRDIITKETKEN